MSDGREPFFSSQRLTQALLALLVIAFGAWSHAVGQAVSEIREVAQDMRVMAKQLQYQEEQIEANRKEIRNHESNPWHRGAGEAIIRLQEQQMRNGKP